MAPDAGGVFNVFTATAAELETMLSTKKVTSVWLVMSYFSHIQNSNKRLNAVIATAPITDLFDIAIALDNERSHGKIRSKLHGIPILIMDNINTDPVLGMGTTVGSRAFEGSIPKQNADVVQRLIDKGLIVLGKANLSELNGWKSSMPMSPSSPVGGVISSAYDTCDDIASRSSPGGSSSGSAVAVSAGMAPLSIGTDTNACLITSAARAALYTIKPTIGIVSTTGMLTISPLFNTAGPMTKTPRDLANLLDILVDPGTSSVPSGGYASVMAGSWASLKIGFLDPAEWRASKKRKLRMRHQQDRAQMDIETLEAYSRIENLAKSPCQYVHLSKSCAMKRVGQQCLHTLINVDFKRNFEEYTSTLDSSPVYKLEELIHFNQRHPDNTLLVKGTTEVKMPEKWRQNRLETALNHNPRKSTFDAALTRIVETGRAEGVDTILRTYDIDVIIGPAESDMSKIAMTYGYPIATLPLGYLRSNGRPFALAALASGHQEATLIKVQGAWEATMGPRMAPPQNNF